MIESYNTNNLKKLNVDNQFDFLKSLNEWGFKTNPLNKLISGVKNLLINYLGCVLKEI
mgnify:CR=1 FL=1